MILPEGRIVEKEKDGKNMVISVRCNYNAMFYWALQYGAYAEVLAPEKLREELAATIRDMNKRYGEKRT
jgi:predicted DNA-binding transcriptional regulator YafY